MHNSTRVLSRQLLERYAARRAPFGFDGLGEFVYQRTYARPVVDETSGELRSERWHETVARVVTGTSNMLEQHKLGKMDSRLAANMYDAMFNMQFLPPGRGLWAMGTPITEERHVYAALNNCAFISTQHIASDPSAPFAFLLDASMLGIGVGFDTAGAGTIRILKHTSTRSVPHVVEDSRQGWVNAYKALIEFYTIKDTAMPAFDFSKVRPAGAPIRGFGGVSGGPTPLIDLIIATGRILEAQRDKFISVRVIVDLMNLIGKAVISGNVRRTAEIAFGKADSQEFLNLKNYKMHPERLEYGWTSNNSIFATVGMDYTEVSKRICDNGEPGLIWLDNMRNYSRMIDPPDNKDVLVLGSNPCVEQTLEDGELCCLVETFPHKCLAYEDWERSLTLAFTYAKIVTLGMTPWERSNSIIKRNRRIGASISGVEQFVAERGLGTLSRWCMAGYEHLKLLDRKLSSDMKLPMSVKRTSVKPSGTVSLLAGATPGVHCPISPYYIRRVRVPSNSSLLPGVINAGYHVEPDNFDSNTLVVSFPVYVGSEMVRSVTDVSIEEQFARAAFMQRYWADNAVSCTVTMNVERDGSALAGCLSRFDRHLKGISVLPAGNAVYPQMPYEAIEKPEYDRMRRNIGPIASVANNEPHRSEFCDGDSCTR